MVSSSKASDSSSQRLRKSESDHGKEAIAALTQKLIQLKRQIQSSRSVTLKEKIERNRIALQLRTCHMFDLAAAAELSMSGSENMLSKRMADEPCMLIGWDPVNGSETVHCQDENFSAETLAFGNGSSAQKSFMCLVKLPLVEKIPPYTTWIFLEKNQRMAEDQSVVGRRRIYYDQNGNEALICSESDEDVPDLEEEKYAFSAGEDQMLWKAVREHGLNREVLNVLGQFIPAKPSEIEERYKRLNDKKENQWNSSGKEASDDQLVLERNLEVALDSFDNLFCRRCLIFDCRLHGCSQNLVFPSERQPSGVLPGERKLCSNQCHLTEKEGQQNTPADFAVPMKLKISVTRLSSIQQDPDSVKDDADRNLPSDLCLEDRSVTGETADTGVDPSSQDASESETDMTIRMLAKRKMLKHGSTSQEERRPAENPTDRKQKRSEDHAAGDPGDEAPEGYSESNSRKHRAISLPAGSQKSSDRISPQKNLANVSKAKSAPYWSPMERDLYVKGVEIFGKNSCLIARNMLPGLKTCLEVHNYMFNNGTAMANRTLATLSNFEDGGNADDEGTEQDDVATRARICRRRGRARKLKYTWKSAGHPAIRKKAGDGKHQSCKQYTPCSCEALCGKDCTCVLSGTCCEKYCGCSKSCKNRFRGCHCAKSQCRSRQCPCFAAGRECDPDVCRNCWVSCGDGLFGEPPMRGDGYQCGNMKLLLKQQQRILLGRSDVAGWGAFIKNPVSRNDYLGEYTGELISHKEADKRGKIYDRANSSFLFDLNDQFVLDAYRKGDKLKFANHSSSPNCYAKVMLVAGDHRVGIYAKENIEAGEELFYDYRYGPDQAPAWAQKPGASKREDAPASHGRAHKVA